jgi:hypothetical protein
MVSVEEFDRLPRLLDSCRGHPGLSWLLRKGAVLALAYGGFGWYCRNGRWRLDNVAVYWNPPGTFAERDAIELSSLEHLQDMLGRKPQYSCGLLHRIVTDLSGHS